MKSMGVMFGKTDADLEGAGTEVYKTILVDLPANTTVSDEVLGEYFKKVVQAKNIEKLSFSGISAFDQNGAAVSGTVTTAGKYFLSAKLGGGAVTGKIEISPNSFPGSYYIQGDTYGRSETTGEDELFIFIIHKAKVLSEVTLTMEAEGDPSTFNLNLKVLRPAGNRPMMELIQYGKEA